jgi:hypothetical protein
VEEATRRAAYRLPPCKENGEGMRDAIIWLQILEFYNTRKNDDPIVFISKNTHDFANQDKTTLRKELESDLQGIKLLYYPSIENFLKEHAKPISHITDEWLLERIDLSFVENIILDFFKTKWHGKWHSDKFKFRKTELNDFYKIGDEISDISVSEVRLDGFIVWEFNESHIELSLVFFAYLEGTTEGELVNTPLYISGASVNVFMSNQVFDCYSELLFHIAASIEGDNIEIGEIDDINLA